MSRPEIVYTVHKFVAENVDEISLNVGEKVFIIEKDEGYNDGWWRGRNEKGSTGLFPISYTVSTPPISILEDEINQMRLSSDSRASKHSSITATSDLNLPKNNTSLSSKNTQSIVLQSLNNPALKTKPVEEWDSIQVAIWLTDIGFDQNLAKTFKDQEITGDILLQLTLESLKELQIDTFGKRFKIHSAINVLKNGSKIPSSIVPPDLNKKSSANFYNNYSDEDLNSNYTISTRNSQLPTTINDDRRPSISNQKLPPPPSSVIRKASQQSTNSTYRWNQPPQEKFNQIQPDRRYTYNIDTQKESDNSKYNLARSSISHQAKIQTILPSKNMTRCSEDSPLQHEAPLVPEMEGWLYKRGDKYKNWNKRWFVLKGSNLFYFKSPKAIRMKGIINLKGYRVELDGSIQTGKYCFKVHHEKERTFYFYTDQERQIKDWVKNLMKATIERDFSTPVMSSNTIQTMSLEAARKKKPRPPSSLFLEQKNRSSSSTGYYRNHDYGLKTMEEHPEEYVFVKSFSSPITPVSRKPSVVHSLENTSSFSLDRHRFKDSGFNSTPSRSLTQSSGSIKENSVIVPHTFYPTEEDEDLIDPESIFERQNRLSEEENESIASYQPTLDQHQLLAKRKYHVDWINFHTSYKIHALSELSTGEVLLELLENLSQKNINCNPANKNQSVYSQMMDRMITVFEHMNKEGVTLTNGYTFRDVLNGREAKIITLLDDIRTWYGDGIMKEKSELI